MLVCVQTANLRTMLAALGAQPGDVLQLQYQGCQGDTVQVAASLLQQAPSRAPSNQAAGQRAGATAAAAAVPASPAGALPATAGEEPASGGHLQSNGLPVPLVRSSSAEGQCVEGMQHGGARAAVEQAEGAAEQAEGAAELLLLWRSHPAAAAAPASGAQETPPAQLAAQRGTAPPSGSAAGAVASPAQASGRAAAPKHGLDGGSGEPAPKRQIVEAAAGSRQWLPAGEELRPGQQRADGPLIQQPQQSQHSSQLEAECGRLCSLGGAPMQQGTVPAASAAGSGPGTGPGDFRGAAPAVTLEAVQEAARLLAAAQQADEQQRPREQMWALMRALRLVGVERSLRTVSKAGLSPAAWVAFMPVCGKEMQGLPGIPLFRKAHLQCERRLLLRFSHPARLGPLLHLPRISPALLQGYLAVYNSFTPVQQQEQVIAIRALLKARDGAAAAAAKEAGRWVDMFVRPHQGSQPA